MSSWTIQPVQDSDVQEFARVQFLAFVNNSLHDVVYPSQQAAEESHHNSLAETGSQKPGNEIVWLKAVDDATGWLIGGIKVCYYGNEDVRTTSPYGRGKDPSEKGLKDEERWQRWVLREFLDKRREGTGYPHSLIDMLFVHPDHHRQGVGRELVAKSCAISDEKGLPGIVEASPAGKRTYELCGYVSKGPITITSDDWPGRPDNLYYWMERKAVGS